MLRSRIWPLLLTVYLAGWIPLNYASELSRVLPSLSSRGGWAAFELGVHGLVTLLCATAGWMVWTRAPAAMPVAAAAVAAACAATLQSLAWTVLPRDLAPGERLPLAALAIVHTAFWMVWLRLNRP
jgi:hypothetical protein